MIKTLVTILLIFSLQGCAFLDYFKKHNEPSIPPGVPVNIAPDALKECNLLNEAILVVTFEDAISAYGSLATEYSGCANKQKTSIKLIKQLGNIK